MGALFAGAIALLICSTSFLSAAGIHHRRNPFGFQGVRGKRSISPTLSSFTDATDDDGNKTNDTLAMLDYRTGNSTTEQSSSENEISTNSGQQHVGEFLRGLPVLSLVKRAPAVGFMGMRGKKDSEYADFDQMDFDGNRDKKLLINFPFRYIPKRAPSGFMGMRGKKFKDDYYKRAPSGFLGMRGKKENNDQYDDLDVNSISHEDDDYDSDFFAKLQDERKMLLNFDKLYGLNSPEIPSDSQSEEHISTEEYEKRAPQNGFFGMRGKKLYEGDSFEDDNDFEKRAPMGFQGMRGKKWDNLDDFQADAEKRAPSMGFQGMRGKKDVSNVLMMDEAEKRAPATGFFGMRGKKQPKTKFFYPEGSSYFGIMRGKKGPYEFRGKFVGVRGKKVPDNALKRLMNELDDLKTSELQSAQLVQSEISQNKRVPNGFMGMRGKKWSSDFTSAEQ